MKTHIEIFVIENKQVVYQTNGVTDILISFFKGISELNKEIHSIFFKNQAIKISKRGRKWVIFILEGDFDYNIIAEGCEQIHLSNDIKNTIELFIKKYYSRNSGILSFE